MLSTTENEIQHSLRNKEKEKSLNILYVLKMIIKNDITNTWNRELKQKTY